MPENKQIVVEIVGEGKTDLGKTTRDPRVEEPVSGVLPVLLHKLCGSPLSMRVKCRKEVFLQGKNLEAKVKFAKRQAKYNGSAAFMCVLDTEGNHPRKIEEMMRGRDAEHPDFPAVVGVAHACIEAWILGDPQAIRRGLGQQQLCQEPSGEPEGLPRLIPT